MSSKMNPLNLCIYSNETKWRKAGFKEYFLQSLPILSNPGNTTLVMDGFSLMQSSKENCGIFFPVVAIPSLFLQTKQPGNASRAPKNKMLPKYFPQIYRTHFTNSRPSHLITHQIQELFIQRKT